MNEPTFPGPITQGCSGCGKPFEVKELREGLCLPCWERPNQRDKIAAILDENRRLRERVNGLVMVIGALLGKEEFDDVETEVRDTADREGILDTEQNQLICGVHFPWSKWRHDILTKTAKKKIKTVRKKMEKAFEQEDPTARLEAIIREMARVRDYLETSQVTSSKEVFSELQESLWLLWKATCDSSKESRELVCAVVDLMENEEQS